MNRLLLIFILIFTNILANCQSLTDLLENDKPDTNYIEATFKSTRLINGQTVETVGKNELNAMINHRFDKINTGISQFYGLDESASIRLGLEYGLTDNIDVSLGRSNTEKLVDGSTKIKILRQCNGALNHPISICYYGSIQAKSGKWPDPTLHYPFYARLSYVNEFIFARKFNSSFSAMIIPGFVHRNMVLHKEDKNLVPFLGIGARFKITQRASVIGEYYYANRGENIENYTNSFSVGYEIETGGHVFQIVFSNSNTMTEKLFIPETIGKWQKGDIRLGFNIMRRFSLQH